MKQTGSKSTEPVKISKAELIALVATQIQGKILFPKLVEEARKMLDRARWVRK